MAAIKEITVKKEHYNGALTLTLHIDKSIDAIGI